MKLYIGNKCFSSWSLRPWVAMKHFGIPFEEGFVRLRTPDTPANLAKVSPNGMVPVLHHDGPYLADRDTFAYDVLHLAPDVPAIDVRVNGVAPRDLLSVRYLGGTPTPPAPPALLEPIRASVRDNVPIAWNRVNDLPDFVYFNHSIHVAKGVACTTCHGPIDRMPLMYQGQPLTMKWCLDCHRDPVKNLRPREEVTNVNWQPPADLAAQQAIWAEMHKVQSKVSCSTCHR